MSALENSPAYEATADEVSHLDDVSGLSAPMLAARLQARATLALCEVIAQVGADTVEAVDAFSERVNDAIRESVPDNPVIEGGAGFEMVAEELRRLDLTFQQWIRKS